MSATSARVSGHTLNFEGAPHDANGVRSWTYRNGTGRGKCSCGSLSDDLPTTAARKRWHREHKAEVIAGRPEPAEIPTQQGENA